MDLKAVIVNYLRRHPGLSVSHLPDDIAWQEAHGRDASHMRAWCASICADPSCAGALIMERRKRRDRYTSADCAAIAAYATDGVYAMDHLDLSPLVHARVADLMRQRDAGKLSERACALAVGRIVCDACSGW